MSRGVFLSGRIHTKLYDRTEGSGFNEESTKKVETKQNKTNATPEKHNMASAWRIQVHATRG